MGSSGVGGKLAAVIFPITTKLPFVKFRRNKLN